jgi:PAS domain S-box-containing protein
MLVGRGQTVANHDIDTPGTWKSRAFSVARVALTILLFAAAVCLLQRLTFILRFPPYERTTIWTPGAVLLAALLLAPPRRWWIYYLGFSLGIFLGYFHDRPIPVTSAMLAAQFAFASTALGAAALRRFGGGSPFGSLHSLLVFVAIVVVPVGVFTSGPIDLLRLIRGEEDVWPVAVRSVLCIALGILIAAPALTLTLANARTWLRESSWKRFAEVAVLAVALVAVGSLIFERPVGEGQFPALVYAPLPLLLWAAVRFGLAGVNWSLLVVVYQSTWGAIHGRGPFVSPSPPDNVLQLQLFLGTISLPLMFLAVVIQERRQAFSALVARKLELLRQFAQLTAIYRTAPIGLAFVDTQLRYVSINDYLAEVNGAPADTHVGRTVREVFPELADRIEPIYRQVIETGLPVVDVEIHGTTSAHPEVERTWLVSRYPVKDLQGSVLGVNTVVQEITERKQAEETRRELAHASRLIMVGELTASIAHEINQPLGAILSNADAAEMLLDSLPDSFDEIKQILEVIRKDDLRASEVIRRVRSLLRKHEMELQPIDLNEASMEVVKMIGTESRRRGVALETDLAGDLPAVRADRVHLQQVLLNLCLNGMDAMADIPEGRRLLVRTALKDDGWVEIAVSDTGVGIRPAQLPRLFDPFFSTRKRGMGLGLSIARSLVEAHGGRIRAENNPGGGATFRFTIPTRKLDPDRGSPIPAASSAELST